MNLKATSTEWNIFNMLSSDLIAKQASQSSTNELLREAYVNLDKLTGPALEIDKVVNNIQKKG